MSMERLNSCKRHLSLEEKMRGECYVRLLVHPDAASAKKAGLESWAKSSQAIVPYIGDMMNPDISLVMGANRPGAQRYEASQAS